MVDPIQWPKALYPRVARGGHWDDDPGQARSAARRGSSEAWKVQDPQLPKSIWYHTDAPWLGFGVVRPLNPPPYSSGRATTTPTSTRSASSRTASGRVSADSPSPERPTDAPTP